LKTAGEYRKLPAGNGGSHFFSQEQTMSVDFPMPVENAQQVPQFADMESFGEFEIWFDQPHVRVVGRTVLALENLLIEAFATQLGPGTVEDDRRRYVASQLTLVIGEAESGSLSFRSVKVYLTKELPKQMANVLVELAIIAALGQAGVAVPGTSGNETKHQEPPQVCDQRSVESIVNSATGVMPNGGRVNVVYQAPSGGTCWINIEIPKS
jgi:hypothetical protein